MINKTDNKIKVVAPFNKKANVDYRNLGGEWDSGIKAWVFPCDDDIYEALLNVLEKYFGYSSTTETATVKITALQDIETSDSEDCIFIGGFCLYKGYKRSGNVGDGVFLLSGKLGGENGAWGRKIKEGTTFKIKNFPKNKVFTDENFKIEIVEENARDKEQVAKEIEALFSELGKEIELIIGEEETKIKVGEKILSI